MMFRRLPKEERAHRLSKITDEQVLALKYDWEFHGRPDQFIPASLPNGEDWRTWLILAGRGWGKTRTGAETIRKWAKKSQFVNLIGATANDARDIMIEGESGILAICPRAERPTHIASKRQLHWPNGAKSLIFTADEPERLRGKQHEKLWADELGAWRYAESWDQAMFGLRLGNNPQVIVTTTPRPIPLVKDLLKSDSTVATRGTTYHNRDNLAKAFFADIIKKYEGTRLGRQELNAEILDDNPGALWARSQVDLTRVAEPPVLIRIVVGVDPSVKEDGSADECGIVVAGLGLDGEFYVLDDKSLHASPLGWAKAVGDTYTWHAADKIVPEKNNGGALVEATLRSYDDTLPIKPVWASRGKRTRAEPVSSLYEQGRVHHVGFFPILEDQMCDWDPGLDENSPDRVDALVWAISELMGDGTGGFAFGSLARK